ncbi:MAG: CopG family antitoxin, partial [Candidatus Methylomirabilis sp.]
EWSRATLPIFPNLKPSTESLSRRLPASLLAELRMLAHKRDVPYQSLLKVFLAERVAQEFARQVTGTHNKRLQPSSRKAARG